MILSMIEMIDIRKTGRPSLKFQRIRESSLFTRNKEQKAAMTSPANIESHGGIQFRRDLAGDLYQSSGRTSSICIAAETLRALCRSVGSRST